MDGTMMDGTVVTERPRERDTKADAFQAPSDPAAAGSS
jgi:hypothetical protein